ncbi:MAG: signal recognition particle-docking protein FtsY [Candidatus Micrarchaeia archaeon]
MFDELRKKISNAVKSFTKKEEEEIKKEEENEANEDNAGSNRNDTKSSKKVDSKEKDSEPINITIGIGTKIKSRVLGNVSLSQNEINNFVDTIERSMLESDVSYETTEHFGKIIKEEMGTHKLDAKHIEEGMISIVKDALMKSLSEKKGVDILEFTKEHISKGEKPVKILFLGPNGTGKTTTIAKIAYMLKGNGISCVMAASDTFRAAAIEQTTFHANKLGIPVVKSSYGADPASIAFDAIAFAKAHGQDVVLIDSAGRQETNKNLLREIEKMVRVAKPDITIYVGESIAGNAIAKQISEFSGTVKIDGIILTKLDCDAKGGGAVSISHTTGIPVLFFGTGEGYDALIKYNPEFVANLILPNA